MTNKENIKELKIVEVGKTTYLGFLSEGKKETTIGKALSVGSFNVNDIKSWIKKNHMNELKDVRIGNGKTIVVVDLNDDEKMQAGVFQKVYANCLKLAVPSIANDLFDKSFS